MSLVDYDSSDEEGTVYYPSEGEEIPPDSSSPQVGNLFLGQITCVLIRSV